MDTVYLVCAIVGSVLIGCQFLLTLLGIGKDFHLGDHDVGGHDVGGQDTGHDGEASWFFGMLTFRTLTAAVAFFGLAGLAATNAEVEPQYALGLAVLAGAGALFLVGLLLRFLTKLNVDGTIRIERAVGSRGTVYLNVPASRAGAGKVHVNFLNRTLEYKAITANDALPTGSPCVVVGVINADTVEIAPASESERTTHV